MENFEVSDYGTYYVATKGAFETIHSSPYANLAPFPPYYYPPFSLWIFSPLVFFSFETGKIIFTVLCILALYLFLKKLLQLSKAQANSIEFSAFLLIMALSHPLRFTIIDGQINLIILLLVTYVCILYSNSRLNQISLPIYVASILKITPAALLIPSLLKRNYKPTVIFSIIALAILILTEFFIQDGISYFYFRYIIDDVGKQGFTIYRDQSFQFFLSHLMPFFSKDLIESMNLSFLNRHRFFSLMNYLIVFSTLGTIFLKYFFSKTKIDSTLTTLYLLLILTVSTIGSGLTWFHHFTILLLPCGYLLLRNFNLAKSQAQILKILAFLAGILMSFNTEFFFDFRPDGLKSFHMLYGSFILIALIIYLIKHEKNLNN